MPLASPSYSVNSIYTAVPLTRGFDAWIDLADTESVLTRKWHVVTINGCRYAAHAYSTERGFKRPVEKLYLHRFLVGAQSGDVVRFRNRDGLDCRRENLILIPRARG